MNALISEPVAELDLTSLGIPDIGAKSPGDTTYCVSVFAF